MDAIMLLGAEAGRSGQQLNPLIFDKIKATKAKIQQGEPMKIFIDCGVNKDTVAALQQAGADSVTANSAFNNAPHYKQAVEEFLSYVK
jgi:pentose-5-phosphate-3-epimerase